MIKSAIFFALVLATTMCLSAVSAFAPSRRSARTRSTHTTLLSSPGDQQVAQSVSGEELELMMEAWDTPLVVDAYATWCGPCLLMAPEFEAAAKALKGKVRFAKLDTDKHEMMAARLNIQGLPTLLFLDKYTAAEETPSSPKAVLKGRIEGAIRKDTIVELAEHYFFGGPEPQVN